jgi:3-oxoadipate enol-lactonase
VPRPGPVDDLSASLARIEAETLLAWGEQAPAIPVEVAREAASRLPNGRLVIEPGLGHTRHLEDDARVVPQIVSFLG